MDNGRIKASSLGRHKPSWLKKRVSFGKCIETEGILEACGLNTVCEEAGCPNRSECFAKGTATFMILGTVCTRNCAFCGITSGTPLAPASDEPQRVAQAAVSMRLQYCVVTAVTRDDLGDGGSSVFAETIQSVRDKAGCLIEVLTPDFMGRQCDIHRVIDVKPDVYNHNLETVHRLYETVRPGASYKRSLGLLEMAGQSGLFVKSGIMVGVGETDEELFTLFEDLLKAECSLLTIGQYLQPAKEAIPVQEYVTPEHFEFLKEKALGMGFKGVSSGPFVRSSYEAHEMYKELAKAAGKEMKNEIKSP